MMSIHLRELLWQDYLILSMCSMFIFINCCLVGLFFKKFSRKRSLMQLFLGLFQLVSAYVALLYGLTQLITISEAWDAFLEEAYIIGIIILPLLLIRIAGEICKTKPRLFVEIIFFGTKLICFIPVLALPTNELVHHLIFIPMVIMLAFVVYFLIYRPHKVKKDLNLDDYVLKIALDMVASSAVLFIVVLFTFAMYGYFQVFTIKFSGFILYFAFLITIYLGYYNPLWWRKLVSPTGECKYCYGEFEECLTSAIPKLDHPESSSVV